MKKIEVTRPLKSIEKLLADVNPLFSIIPLKVTMPFRMLNDTQLEDLKEFANIEDGTVERWLLVPDSYPLGALSYVIEKAFGFLPMPVINDFEFEQREFNSRFPTLKEFLPYSGVIFDNTPDDSYNMHMSMFAMASPVSVPFFPETMIIDSGANPEKDEEGVRKALEVLNDKSVKYNGVHYDDIESWPTDFDFINGVIDENTKGDEEEGVFVFNRLRDDLEIRAVLEVEGKAPHRLEDITWRQLYPFKNELRRAKPFTNKIVMKKYDEDGVPGFIFEITRPKDVYSLITDGYISVDDYLESLHYCAQTMLPDCICKKGYDLIGFNEDFYYDFIMMLHGPDRVEAEEDARNVGWREPFMDLKKVLR